MFKISVDGLNSMKDGIIGQFEINRLYDITPQADSLNDELKEGIQYAKPGLSNE